MPADRIETVVSLCKRRGFVFPSGEIYGGTRSAWDYGPLGVELKENVKRQWWRAMVTGRDDVVGLDSSVILPRQVWEASGHVEVFHDPLVECQSCHKRFRSDQLVDAALVIAQLQNDSDPHRRRQGSQQLAGRRQGGPRAGRCRSRRRSAGRMFVETGIRETGIRETGVR